MFASIVNLYCIRLQFWLSGIKFVAVDKQKLVIEYFSHFFFVQIISVLNKKLLNVYGINEFVSQNLFEKKAKLLVQFLFL
jgi:hypothetical protein